MTPHSAHQQLGNLPSLAGESWLSADAIQQVLGILETAGFEARIVGGAVRNALLQKPVQDLDIATTALPEEVIAVAKSAGLSAVPTGLKHGTITVLSGTQAFEVTTLREDVATDGRHADVRFTGSWEADASRRDFTINALYCDARGNIFDPLSGIHDIAKPRIRFVGDPNQRITEDYLRILRFFRFFAEYGKGTPEQNDLAACVSGRQGLRQLSRERVRQEFLKLLVAPRAAAAIDAMYCYGLLSALLPIAPRINHFARLLGASPNASSMLRLATLSLATFEDAERITDALKLSNRQKANLINIATAVQAERQPPSLHIARQCIYAKGAKNFQDQVSYLSSSTFRALSDPQWFSLEQLAQEWTAPKFPFAGEDVLALGVKHGPEVGKILKMAEEKWIESDFKMTNSELSEYIQNKLQNCKHLINQDPAKS